MQQEALITIAETPDQKWTWKIYDESARVVGQQEGCASWAEAFTEIITWLEPEFGRPPEITAAQLSAQERRAPRRRDDKRTRPGQDRGANKPPAVRQAQASAPQPAKASRSPAPGRTPRNRRKA